MNVNEKKSSYKLRRCSVFPSDRPLIIEINADRWTLLPATIKRLYKMEGIKPQANPSKKYLRNLKRFLFAAQKSHKEIQPTIITFISEMKNARPDEIPRIIVEDFLKSDLRNLTASQSRKTEQKTVSAKPPLAFMEKSIKNREGKQKNKTADNVPKFDEI